VEQVREQNHANANLKAENSQRVTGNSNLTEPASPSLIDKKLTPRTRLKRRKKGGWKALKGLRLDEVKRVCQLRKDAAAAGTPLNNFVSIKPTDAAITANDNICKRYLSNKAKNIIQAVRGHGKEPRQQTVPCVTVYEKDADGGLHCHMLTHVKRGNDALERLSDGLEIHSKKVHGNSERYILKSRLPIGDAEAEAKFVQATGLFRKGRQASIKGARISFNGDAKALLSSTSHAAVIAVAEPVTVTPVTLVEPEQLALPLDAPPVNLIQLVEQKRQRLGLPQSLVARQLGGLKQPAYANALRGHDRLGAWRRNRALAWLAA